ncbi:hypothetical protein Tco_1530463 [Tanacetum coccineum]
MMIKKKKKKKMMSKFTEPKEVGKEDAKMTETTHESASQEKSYDKFLNLDNAPPVIDEVASMMNVKTSHEELCTQATPNNSVPVMAIRKFLLFCNDRYSENSAILFYSTDDNNNTCTNNRTYDFLSF